MRSTLFLLCLSPLVSAVSIAQEPAPVPLSPAPIPLPQVKLSVDVTTVEPMLFSEDLPERSVVQFDLREHPLLFNNPVDYLRQDAALNLESRAGNGVQADLSIRGTTFEQTLVLVNGLRINDPETGHLNLDIPVPLEAIARIDVLHGSGSTVYGSDAIGGAVNLITRPPAVTSIITKAGFGNLGAEEQHLQAGLHLDAIDGQLTGSRDTSNGFYSGGSNDRGYHSNALAAETWLHHSELGTTDILVAGSDRPYGANLFYGPYPSWERTKGWFGSVQQQLGPKTALDFAYLKHTDLFVLFDGQPSIYENNHVASNWEGALRRTDDLGKQSTVSYGLEADADTIASSNLGHHGRNQGAGYANLNLHEFKRLSLTIGAREEVLSGGDNVFSPSFAEAFRLTGNLRLRGAAGHGFRLPTYVDLNYSDPTTIGNPNLKPETSWSYEGGLDWTPGGRFRFSATGFQLNQHNAIDYSKYSLADKWQAINVDHLNFTGAETSAHVRLSGSQEIGLSYTAVRAAAPPAGLISEYAYNYAAQRAVFSWSGELLHQVIARTQVAAVQRTQHTVYPLWDLSIARSQGRVQPYLRLINLSNTGYEEIPGVPLPGRTIMGGVAYVWNRAGR
ncbi:TonB-dependent receptor plug domain-containing protein [Granulicella aggregans]|uniref:TonB-dependent receptor plug domain-containing protein n=1 Tax=Granulicella aggregans TaxID=474949 RepID=UPI0021DFF8BA|nr:TonB-dependent receptor [Granulicella aggregans]